MTVTDIVIVCILLFFVWNGYRTGFVLQVVRFVGIFVAYWIAKTFSPNFIPWLESIIGQSHASFSTDLTKTIMQNGYGVLSFAITFFLCLILTGLIGRVLNVLVSLPGISFLNRLAGLIVGLVAGVLILIVLVNIGLYVPSENLQLALRNSQIVAILLDTEISRILFSR